MDNGLFGITEHYVIWTHSFYWCVSYILYNCFCPLIKVKEDIDRTLRYDLHSAKQKVLSTFFVRNLISCIENNQVLYLTTSEWNVLLKSVGMCQRSRASFCQHAVSGTWEELRYAPVSRGPMWSVTAQIILGLTIKTGTRSHIKHVAYDQPE